MNKVLVVIGPTGVGKTKMGVELAKAFDGEVISGDSMQIYKHMDIGTAKVTNAEMQGIKHHLIDIKEPTDSYSVKDFQDEVRTKIDEITARNKLPIIVGGTGLYIKGALYDYTFSETQTKHEEYKEKFKDYTNMQLYDYLKSFDEASALELHPNNRQRILRAIEIYETTGTRKSDIQAQQQHICLYDATFIGLTIEREILYQRINQRVDKMIADGLEEEVTALYQQGLTKDNQSMKAIGYKEWFDYFDHTKTKAEVIELIKQHSRQYAKRQYTWFKNQFDVHWYDVDLNNFQTTVNTVIKDVS